MKCPTCGEGLGLRNLLSTSPGTPFPCRSCGAPLKIKPGRAVMVAGIALLLCLVPLTGIVPGGLALFWIIAVGGGAFYAYASLAVPHDPDEVLSFGSGSGKVELLPEGIRYRGQLHSYASVVHLARYARKTSINFIPMEEYLRLRIYLKGVTKPVTLQNSLGLILTTSGLQEIYLALAEKTFHARIRNYLTQLNSRGFFEFGGARFHRDGQVSFGDTKLDLRAVKLTFEPFKLVLNPPGMLSRKRSVDAEIDQDVLLVLLREVYGITFKF